MHNFLKKKNMHCVPNRVVSLGSRPALTISSRRLGSKERLSSKRRVTLVRISLSWGTSFASFLITPSEACSKREENKEALYFSCSPPLSLSFSPSLSPSLPPSLSFTLSYPSRHTISSLFSTKMLSFLRKETTRMSSSWFALSSSDTSWVTSPLFLIFCSTCISSAKFNSR